SAFDKVYIGTQPLTNAQVGALLDITIQQTLTSVRAAIPGFDQITNVGRQVVLADMMFNLGPSRFGQFQNMIAAVNANDWAAAADEMQDSAWYGQVGGRAVRDVTGMRNGTVPSSTSWGGGKTGKDNKDGKESLDKAKDGKEASDKGKDGKESAD